MYISSSRRKDVEVVFAQAGRRMKIKTEPQIEEPLNETATVDESSITGPPTTELLIGALVKTEPVMSEAPNQSSPVEPELPQPAPESPKTTPKSREKTQSEGNQVKAKKRRRQEGMSLLARHKVGCDKHQEDNNEIVISEISPEKTDLSPSPKKRIALFSVEDNFDDGLRGENTGSAISVADEKLIEEADKLFRPDHKYFSHSYVTAEEAKNEDLNGHLVKIVDFDRDFRFPGIMIKFSKNTTLRKMTAIELFKWNPVLLVDWYRHFYETQAHRSEALSKVFGLGELVMSKSIPHYVKMKYLVEKDNQVKLRRLVALKKACDKRLEEKMKKRLRNEARLIGQENDRELQVKKSKKDSRQKDRRPKS